MLHLSEALPKENKQDNIILEGGFLINAKQDFCKNTKVLKQCRQKNGWVECVSNKFLLAQKNKYSFKSLSNFKQLTSELCLESN